MLACLTVAAAFWQLSTPVTWYGPVTATFQVQFAGNPYDPAENDVRVQFLGPKEVKEERIAYFDQKQGAWKAVFLTQRPGDFRARLIRNGTDAHQAPTQKLFHLDKPLPHGFVRVDPNHANRFQWDDGTPYVPIGFDLGWQEPSNVDLTGELAKMGRNGVNWTRIWACSWDDKNPWWPKDNKPDLKGQLWPPALERWDQLEREAERDGVEIQMTLFHHGEFSSTTDSNWNENPWNAKNGGFLKDPGDFFTDAEAKRRARIWLRYAVARYGGSPQLFAWELFNEVQWVDAAKTENRWTDVEAWHKEMAEYLRSIDPYHHLVTTSSEMRPALNAPMDFVQPHTYPSNILASVIGTVMPQDKPGFYGEFGPSDGSSTDWRQDARDGTLGGLLANHAGSAMFWYWGAVEKNNLYGEYAVARKVSDESDWARHPSAHIADLGVRTKERSTFSFAPGLGWGASTQTTFDLPEGASPAALGKLSSFLQGASHKDMGGPVTLRFQVPEASDMRISIGQISDSGGNLEVVVDGASAFKESFKKGDAAKPVDVKLKAGTHEVVLKNDGPDWIVLNRLTITHLAPAASVVALAEPGWMMARVTAENKPESPIEVRLTRVPLSDGVYQTQTIDLNTGVSTVGTLEVKNFEILLPLALADEMVIFKKT